MTHEPLDLDARDDAAPPGAGAAARASARTCVGCGERVDPKAELDLVRLVIGPGGVVAVDAKGGAFGRGAHVHARPACVEHASARGLARSFKCKIEGVVVGDAIEAATPASLGRAIAAAFDRRIEGLVASALRARSLAFGADAAGGALERGEGKLAIVAIDAAAAADLGPVRAAVAAGRAVAWGTKATLGALCSPGRSRDVGVVAILDDRIAHAIAAAVQARCGALTEAAAGGRRRKGSPPDENSVRRIPGSAGTFQSRGARCMSKVRVYEVAKQLNMDQKALVALFQSMGVDDVRNHMSAVEPDAVERLKRHLERQKTPGGVEERVRADGRVVKRRARPDAVESVRQAPAPEPSQPGSRAHVDEAPSARGVAHPPPSAPAAPPSRHDVVDEAPPPPPRSRREAAAPAEAPASKPRSHATAAAAPASEPKHVAAAPPSAREAEAPAALRGEVAQVARVREARHGAVRA